MQRFAAAMHAYGLEADRLQADGYIHRVRADGDKGGKRSGWYVLYLDVAPSGAFGDWRTGDMQRWHCATEHPPSIAERRRIDAAIVLAREQRERERAAGRRAAQTKAISEWDAADPAKPTHPYLEQKGVAAYGLRQRGGRVLIPMRDIDGKLWALQSISANGSKRFMRSARKRGLYHAIGGTPIDVLCVAEGYATAASIHEATGYPVAVAFDCGNLLPVARALRAKYPSVRLVLCADNDTATAERLGRNPGIEAATAAARAVGGIVVSPPNVPALPDQGMFDETCPFAFT